MAREIGLAGVHVHNPMIDYGVGAVLMSGEPPLMPEPFMPDVAETERRWVRPGAKNRTDSHAESREGA